jgi:hypothetical protein
MDQDVSGIRSEMADLMWFSRGGLSYEDAYHLSPADRKMFADQVKQHMETTKKSGLPFY